MFARRTIPMIAPLLLPRFDGDEEEKDTDTFKLLQDMRELIRTGANKDAVAAFNEQVISDNHRMRRRNRELRTQLEKQVPEGAIVLTADDAKAWAEYQKLGKPEDVAKVVTERDELKKDKATREHESSIDAAAEALGYAPNVMKQLKGIDAMKVEVVEETVNGEKAKVVYVTGAEQGAQRKKLDEEHVEATWPGILPALQADAATPQPRSGTTFPAQQPARAPKPGTKTDDDFRKATEQTASYTL